MTAPADTSTSPQYAPELAWLAAWLVNNHQVQQESIALAVAKRLLPLWRILDFRDLKGSRTPWIQAVLPVVQAGYSASQQAAAKFMVDVRHASLPAARDLAEVTPDPFPAIQSAVSLLSTGPGEVLAQMPAEEKQAMDAGLVKSSKVSMRIVGDGGRNLVQQRVDHDRSALGFARVLDGNPCYFCSMLASRGAEFKERSFDASNAKFKGDGVAKVHDGCHCTLKPVYSQLDSRDPVSQALLKQWEANTEGFTGHDMVKAFRRNYVAPQQPPAPMFDLESLEKQREKLLRQGFGENSTQVQWVNDQITRFSSLPQAA